jgi:hypothetical protein
MIRASVKEIIEILGQPKQNTNNLKKLKLPYPMYLSWSTKTKINYILVHPAIYDAMRNVFADIVSSYTMKQIKELGLDMYGGCYAYRKERGGTELSRHAWGIAIDFDPSRNQLKSKKKDAKIDDPDYDAFRASMRKNGMLSLGELSDYDWMHFEASLELLTKNIII